MDGLSEKSGSLEVGGGSTSSLVITLEGAELTLSLTSGGFSYTIETQSGSNLENEVLASGHVPLNIRGKLLIRQVMILFQNAGPLRVGKFEARVVDDDILVTPPAVSHDTA